MAVQCLKNHGWETRTFSLISWFLLESLPFSAIVNITICLFVFLLIYWCNDFEGTILAFLDQTPLGHTVLF